MPKRLIEIATLFLALVAAPAAVCAQSTHLLIVVGLGGTPAHGELFKKWDTTLADPDGYCLHFESPTDTPEETKLSETKE